MTLFLPAGTWTAQCPTSRTQASLSGDQGQQTTIWSSRRGLASTLFSIDVTHPDAVPEAGVHAITILHSFCADFKYIPFSGGPRKCVGDQFALMEALVGLAVILQRYTFATVPGFDPGMTTGATIHTKNGLYLYVKRREVSPAQMVRRAAPRGLVGVVTIAP